MYYKQWSLFQADCVLDAEMHAAINMFRILYQELHDRAVTVACRGSSSSSENSALSDAQLIQLVVEKQDKMVSAVCTVCVWGGDAYQ